MKINEIIKLNQDFLILIENEELDEETIKDTLELIKMEIKEKGNNIIAYYRDLDTDIEKNKQIGNLYNEYAKKLENRKNNIKKLIASFMIATNTEKIETDYGKISFRKSKAVEISDERLLPESCFIIKKEVSKTAIKKAIENNEDIQGASIIENKSLQIK